MDKENKNIDHLKLSPNSRGIIRRVNSIEEPNQDSPKKPLVVSFRRRSTKLAEPEKPARNLNKKEDLLSLAQENYIKYKFKKSTMNRPHEFYSQKIIDKNLLDSLNIDFSDEIKEILNILTKKCSKRSNKDYDLLYNFFIKTKIQENLKTDLIITDFCIKELYEHLKKYVSGKIYKKYEPIYYSGEEVNNIYIVLYGSVGLYKLITDEESLTCEEYLIKICDAYNTNEEIKLKESEDIEEYIDLYLLYFITEENKDSFPLHNFSDIPNLKKILLKARIYNIITDNLMENINDLYAKFNVPLNYLDYDKVISNEVTMSDFSQKIKISCKDKEIFYSKLFSQTKHTVKLMKYKKVKIVKPFEYFGNFEIINQFSLRNNTTRAESENTILMSVNKFLYASNINNLQKNLREKEIWSLYREYFFNKINRNYFAQKIYSDYIIDCLFKGDLLFEQDEPMNSFIFVKEGIVELSLKNLSLIELAQKIKQTKETIIKKANINSIEISQLIDFDEDLETNMPNIDEKTASIFLNQKQNYVFSRSEKGVFGDYELFCHLPSFITGTIVSDKSKIYFYDFEKYKNLTEETYALNQSLKDSAFNKMKAILKRMIAVYNTYFRLTVKKSISESNDNNSFIFGKTDIEKKFDNNKDEKINNNGNDIIVNQNNVKYIKEIKLKDINDFDFLMNKGCNTERSLVLTKKKNKIKLKKINQFYLSRNDKIKNLSELKHKKYSSVFVQSFHNLEKNLQLKDVGKNNKNNSKKKNKSNLGKVLKKNEQIKSVFLPPILKNYEIKCDSTSEENSIPGVCRSKKAKNFIKDSILNLNLNNTSDKKIVDNYLDEREFKKIQKIKSMSIKNAQIKSLRNSRIKNKHLWMIAYNNMNLEYSPTE